MKKREDAPTNVRLGIEDKKALESIKKNAPRPAGMKLTTSAAIKAAIHAYAELLTATIKK